MKTTVDWRAMNQYLIFRVAVLMMDFVLFRHHRGDYACNSQAVNFTPFTTQTIFACVKVGQMVFRKLFEKQGPIARCAVITDIAKKKDRGKDWLPSCT